MKRLLAFLAVIFLPTIVFAQSQVKQSQTGVFYLLNGVACNASSNARTFILAETPGGFATLAMHFEFTKVTGGTINIATQCFTRPTTSNQWAPAAICLSTASGVCTQGDASWTRPMTASGAFAMRYDYLGSKNIKCTVTCSSGGASDLISAWGVYSAQ